MNLADADLLAREPRLPALALVLAPDRLGDALRDRAPDLVGDGWAGVHRLRYKPGTSVLAAITVRDPDGGVRWLRFGGYRRGEDTKLRKDLRSARRRGPGATAGSAVDAWSVAGAEADRRLRARQLTRLGGPWTTVSYNPGRRLVARLGPASEPGLVARLHAPGRARPAAALLDALHRAGVAAPVPRRSTGPGLTLTEWVPGRPADPGHDGRAVSESLARLQSVDAPGGGGDLDPDALALRSRRALRFVAAVLPDRARAAAELGARLAAGLADGAGGPCGLVHGDLSPDQVVMASATGRAVLVDLDTLGRGPSGWDRATWWAAQVATGSERPVALPGPHPPAPLLAAALALRAPEPFRRRRPGWDRITARMLDGALGLLGAPRTTGVGGPCR